MSAMRRIGAQLWRLAMGGVVVGLSALCACAPESGVIEPTRAAVLTEPEDRLIEAQTELNQYAVLAQDAAVGSQHLILTNIGALSMLRVADLLLVIQMQGARLDSQPDDPRYGEITELGSCGQYELLIVTEVDTATNAVKVQGRGPDRGLRFSYSAAGRAQVVRVPKFHTLTIARGGTVTAPAWNGHTGGVVALVADALVVDGTITASGRGFRGGQLQSNAAQDATGFRTTSALGAAERGEGIGGGPADYDQGTGRFGRGAAGNGGGGGNGYNAAGGGGGGGRAAGKVWTGQGVMDLSTEDFKAAWQHDPAYDSVGGRFADSAGGGRGGYACSSAALDPLALAPGAASWGCGSRAAVGGLGGRPLRSELSASGRLFFGGGGGSGHQDTGNGGSGGSGGGIVWVLARTINSPAGSGRISASGGAGGGAGLLDALNDGPGGGGGGGTVALFSSTSIGAVEVSARGGNGGNHRTASSSAEATGGGGGGGGGSVLLLGPGGAALQPQVAGGPAGRTNQAAFRRFAPNGATDGAAGALHVRDGFAADLPSAVHAIDLALTLALAATPVSGAPLEQRPGYSVAELHVAVENSGLDDSTAVTLTLTLPPSLYGRPLQSDGWNCGMPGATLSCTRPCLVAKERAELAVYLYVLNEPQGPFTIQGEVSGGGFEITTTNNRATLSGEVAGYVNLAGGGLGCAVAGPAGRRGGSFELVLMTVLLGGGLLLRRRSLPAQALCLLALLVGPGGCGEDMSSLPIAMSRWPLYPDGDVTLTKFTLVTSQAVLAADAAKGTSRLTVSPAGLAALNVKAGDMVMVYQAQGAQIVTSDDETYGQITDLRGAGLYELTRVSSTDAATGQIEIEPRCHGLRNSYSVAGRTQVLSVPQYKNLVMTASSTLKPYRWEYPTGVGGVLALRAREMKLDGVLDVSALGFRGPSSVPATFLPDQTAFVSATPGRCGEKGESIAGAAPDYAALGGVGCRGAPANGGGGGNRTGAGGGGGSNAGAVELYTGHGIMDPAYSVGWQLDPEVIARGALATSTGGGRGGYTQAQTQQDPLTVPPGSAAWGGAQRRERGGRGGKPLLASASRRVFFGGSGGSAPKAFTPPPFPAPAGGGFVFLLARHVYSTNSTGNQIRAGGGVYGGSQFGEVPGDGGGGGGSVVLAVKRTEGIAVNATGGSGFALNVLIPPRVQAYGPGGGGGGGFIAAPLAQLRNADVSGGRAGTTDSLSMAAFPTDGATDGAPGVVSEIGPLSALPVCLLADLQVSLTATVERVRVGEPFELAATVSNSGPDEADDITLTLPLPAGLTVLAAPTGDTWSCAAAGTTYVCRMSELDIGATAPPVRFQLAARDDAPHTLPFTARATADTPDPLPGDSTVAVAVEDDRVRGGGFGCRMAAHASSQTCCIGPWLLGLWFLQAMRRRARVQSEGLHAK